MGIRTLARELGLSIGTVSRALNDRPDVNEATRARVKAAALRLGYVANQSGRSLRTGQTGMIAAVLPPGGRDGGAGSLFLAVFEGTRRGLRAAGLDLMLLIRGAEEDPVDHLHRVTARRLADGVLLTRTEPQDPRLAFLKERRIPHAAMGRSDGLAADAWVDLDVEAAVGRAADLLLAAGHRRFGLVVRDPGLTFNRLMAATLAARAARHGLAPEAVRLFAARPGEAGPRPEDLGGAGAPSAYLVADDGLALVVYAALAGDGRQAGRDAAVICILPALDSDPLRPRLSHFRADLGALGGELAERILAALPGGRGEGKSLLGPSRPLPLTFVPRESHLARGPGRGG